METKYKKKPLIYKLKQFYASHLCTYNNRFIPIQWFRNFKYWIKYTFISPSNVVKIKTLKRGSWIDRDEILLHSSFQILTDYVEKECSGQYYKIELINIEEEMKAFADWSEEERIGHRDSLEEQNRYYKEILDLYDWWNVRRPIREKNDPFTIEDKDFDLLWDPSDEDRVESRDEYGDPLTYSFMLKPNAERSAYYDRQRKYEEMSDKEDEEMLIRLMKIRKFLWS
jgi:hypothetical protein